MPRGPAPDPPPDPTVVLTRGPISRVDIARLTGLSSAAVTKTARPFIEAGYLEESPGVDRVVTGAGRPASPLAAGLLADATGLAVTLENDVKALTVARLWFGEGVVASSFALVTMGSGIGCGLVLDGRLVTGAYGVAGFASTEAIVAACGAATGRDLTADEAVALARAGDVHLVSGDAEAVRPRLRVSGARPETGTGEATCVNIHSS